MKKLNKKLIIRCLFSFIGIGLFVYLISSINIDRILETIMNINLFYFAISLLLVPFRVAWGVLAWKILAKDQDVDLSFFEMTKILLIGFFFSSVTPGALGNYIRIKFLHDREKDLGKSISNVIIDASVKSISLHLFATLALFIFFPDKLFLLSGVFLLIATSVLPPIIIYRGKKLSNKLLESFLIPYIPKKYREKLSRNIENIFKDPPHPRTLAKSFAVVVFFIQPLVYLQIYLISLSLGIERSNIELPIIWIISQSLSYLPITIAGLGVREWGVTYLSNKYGIENSIAFSLSLLGFLVSVVFPALLGAVIFIYESLKNVRIIR